MRKFMTALLAAALCIGVFGTASAELKWVTERLAIRTLKAATPDGGANDSLTASLGSAATFDTTVALRYPVRAVPNLPDSQQFVIVHVSFGTAIASGESLYVGMDGSGDNAVNWRGLNLNTIPIGAPITGQVIGGNVSWMSKANSATNATAFSPVGPPTSAYGNWFGWPRLRIRIGSDRSASMAVAGAGNPYQVWVTYMTDK
jgi:hypothetical protein